MRGGQHQVLLLLNTLKVAGHSSVLLARSGSPLYLAAAAQGFQVQPADVKHLWLHSKNADIVHAHDARAHTIAAIAARGKFVVSRRVAFPVKRSVVSTWKYQRPSRFLAVSQFVAVELESAGIRREKIDIVYDAVNTEDAERANRWDASHPAVALASDDPMKGKDLIKAAAARAQLNVVFSDNLTRDLRRASMFVYITRSEGLGSAVLLAMQMAVPVIASRVGGIVEILADGISGLFVENQEHAIAAAMLRVLNERGLAQHLIAAGKEQIRNCFTPQHLLRGTVGSYQKALGLG
jgi:glycosyltransferase involved in cell wall biosynthesis